MTFQELMDCYYMGQYDNNQIVYNRLLEMVKRHNITPVIGAGISSWAYPLWGRMLEGRLEEYGLQEEAGQLFKDGQYEKVASLLEKWLTPNGLIQLMEEIFDPAEMEKKANQCPDYLNLLPDLFTGPILTTNFDRGIERIYLKSQKRPPDMVIPTDEFQKEKISSSIHDQDHLLIKMHGDIGDPGHIVLTKESYDATYGNDPDHPDEDRPMPKILKTVLGRNPLLFLGCSLKTDRTSAVIRSCIKKERIKEGCHFAFLELPKETENKEDFRYPYLKDNNGQPKKTFSERQRQLKENLNIRIIWYPYGKHEEAFRALFTKLHEDMLKEASSSVHRLIEKLPHLRSDVLGRKDQLAEIDEVFQKGERILFLEGIGGIGKSELAKKYAVEHRKEYSNIVFMTYPSSLQEMVCDASALEITNLAQAPKEKDRDFFRRKLKVLRELTDEKTLLIVDNFDVDDDANLEEFLEGSCRFIFTTRFAHPGYRKIEVKAIENIETLLEIFKTYYGGDIAGKEQKYLLEIFEYVDRHTYAIELIAKQMAASNLGAKSMLEFLKRGELAAPETVEGRGCRKSTFDHISALFDMSALSAEERKIMRNLSLMGIQGVPASYFREWTSLPSFESINRLIRRSWIRMEIGEEGERYSLHPLVKEVVRHILCPNVESCRSFLEQVAKFCSSAWGRCYRDNLPAAGGIQEFLTQFEPDGREIAIYEPCIGFLWQVGKFEDSIRYFHKLYNSCLQIFGEASWETGCAAKSLGGAYFNSRAMQKSVTWYQKGLKSMLLARKGEEDQEDLAMSYEKVARCYTWPENPDQDLEKAQEYFDISCSMRQRLIEAMERGERRSVLINKDHYNLNTAKAYLAETYMEMGRMCQVKRQFEKALKYANLYEEIIAIYQPDNRSGLAYAHYDQGICMYYLGIREKEKGNEHEAMEKWKKAEEKLEEALQSNLEMRGALAFDTIDNQEYLADVYMAMAQELCSWALGGYEKAKAMAESLDGKNSSRVKAIEDKKCKMAAM